MIYLILKHSHSGLRWLVLLLLLIVVFNSFYKLIAKKSFQLIEREIALISMGITHIQVLVGLILYFLSPNVIFSASSMSNDLQRFFLVEHVSLMILAAVSITLGYGLSKRASTDRGKHLRLSLFYLLGLLLILAAIPWPWMPYSAGWF